MPSWRINNFLLHSWLSKQLRFQNDARIRTFMRLALRTYAVRPYEKIILSAATKRLDYPYASARLIALPAISEIEPIDHEQAHKVVAGAPTLLFGGT
jgi:hypothetical protein